MAEQRAARELWTEVGQRFGDLRRAVRGHLEPESADSATWTAPSAEGDGDRWGDRRGDRRGDRWDDRRTRLDEARDTARWVGRNAQLLAGQAGEAARDPAVRSSARQAARSLGAALSRNVEDLGTQLRGNLRSPRWSDESRPRPTSAPPVAPVDPERDRREP